VLAKAPGRPATTCTHLLTEEDARAKLDLLIGDVRVRSVQYALAELQLTQETYR
jgi:hypothetical protein